MAELFRHRFAVEVEESAKWSAIPVEDVSSTATAECSETLESQETRGSRSPLWSEQALKACDHSAFTMEGTHAVVVIGEHAWGGGAFEGIPCRPLMELAGRPLIVHILAWLRQQGILTAAICANGQTRLIRRRIGDGRSHGMSLQYYEDVMPRGPAGCIRDAAIDAGAETILAVSGTVVPRMSIEKAYRLHRQADACATVLSITGRGGALAPSGLYLLSQAALIPIAATGYQDIKETLLPQLRKLGGRVVLSRMAPDDLLRVTDLESYVRANRTLIEESLDSVCGDEYIRFGEACIHEACDIHPTARLVGPVVVGAGCTIEEEAVIIGPASVAAGCWIGSRAVVSRSTIWPFCRIGSDAVLDNSLLRQGSVVQPKAWLTDTFWTQVRRPRRTVRTWQPSLRALGRRCDP